MTTRKPYAKRLQDHLKETKSHARELERRIKQLGGGGPQLADKVAGQAVGKAKSLAKGPLHMVRGTGEAEKMLKNAKTEYFNEHEEIATYTAIETLAESVSDAETAKLARAIRRDEERMANYLAKQIPVLTKAVVTEEIPASRSGGTNGGRKRAQAHGAQLAASGSRSAQRGRSRSPRRSRELAALSATPPSARPRRARRPRAARRGSPGGRPPPAPGRAGGRSAPGARRRRAR